jgi:hypothetical protein
MYELWNINSKPERDVWELIHHVQACSLYFTTHTSRSGLQFIFHNIYITLRLTVYISQLIHYTHLSVMYELWNINCKSERDVWVVKYKLQAWAWCMSCEIQTVSRSVMCVYFATHTLRSGLQFIFRNSYITLRLTVCISQLKYKL